MHPCLYVHALPFRAALDVLLAMDMTTPMPPRVRCFVPFMGQKDEALQPGPSREIPLR